MSGLDSSGRFPFVRTYTREQLIAIAAAIDIEQDKIVAANPQDITPAEHALNLAAFWYRAALPRAIKRARPSQLRDRLNRVSRSARSLLMNLGIREIDFAEDGPDDDAILEALAASEDHDLVIQAAAQIGRLVEVLDTIRAAYGLDRRARKGADEAIDLGGHIVPKGHIGNDPIIGWMTQVVPIYEELTGRRAGTSTSAADGSAQGPLIRFFQTAALPLRISLPNESWRHRYRRLQGKRDNAHNSI